MSNDILYSMTNVYINGLDLTNAKKVLLIAKESLILEDALEVRKVMAERFPDIEWTILDGFEAILVKENTPSYDFEVDSDE